MDLEAEISTWHLYFGFIDRYFEIIESEDFSRQNWTGIDYYLSVGIGLPSSGFTSHPKFLEIADTLGLIEVWETRGPPDFCEKVDAQWVCNQAN